MRAPEGGVLAVAVGIYGTWPAVSLAGEGVTGEAGVAGGPSHRVSTASSLPHEDTVVRPNSISGVVFIFVIVIVGAALTRFQEAAPGIRVSRQQVEQANKIVVEARHGDHG